MLVAFLVPSDGHMLEFGGPADVFEETNRQLGYRAYDIKVISEEPEPITCLSGLRVIPDRTIRDPDEPIDTLLVTGSREPTGAASPLLIEWLQRHCASARRYGAVCSGAFLLGAAGLLDNKNVTTHWDFASDLAAAFPSAHVEPDRIFVRDARMFTSAGVTAGIDLALALVEEDFGRDVALAVARWLVVFLKRPGGQSQFSIQLAAQIAVGPPMQGIQQWVRDNPQEELSVRNLARRAAMSERSFARIFRAETGMTPAYYVQATRVDTARRLLEETELPLQRVASATGLTGTQALRRAFRKHLGVNPTDYRSRFRLPRDPRGSAGSRS